MDFKQLQSFLADWYETDPKEFQLSKSAVSAIENPVLKEFYFLFGKLAETNNPFSHSKSIYGPLSAQDHFLPYLDLEIDGDITIFLIENQGNFEIGAKGVSLNGFVAGLLDSTEEASFEDSGVPLVELLAANALKETVLSVDDRHRSITIEDKMNWIEILNSESSQQLRYVSRDEFVSYHITKDLIAFGFSNNPDFFALRGMWKKPPPRMQLIERENGGRVETYTSEATKFSKIWTTASIYFKKLFRLSKSNR